MMTLTGGVAPGVAVTLSSFVVAGVGWVERGQAYWRVRPVMTGRALAGEARVTPSSRPAPSDGTASMTTPPRIRAEVPHLPALQRLRHWQLTRPLGSAPVSEVLVERDIPVPMADGTVLLTEHWVPTTPRPGAPVLLTRTPYGREGCAAGALAFAERGHHVVVQSCRGHFGSEGSFNPFFDEAADGLDCVAWIEAQPWFTGRIHTYGGSYVGLTQWALTPSLPPSVEAMVIAVSARSFLHSVLHHRGGFGMETAVTWHVVLGSMEDSAMRQLRRQLAARGAVRRGSDALPPTRAVERATGSDTAFFQDWLARGPDDAWWEPIDFVRAPRRCLPSCSSPASTTSSAMPRSRTSSHSALLADRFDSSLGRGHTSPPRSVPSPWQSRCASSPGSRRCMPSRPSASDRSGHGSG